MPAVEPTVTPAVDVGRHAQLFIDKLLVDSSSGVAFTQHQGTTHPQNPLVVPDQSWEGWRLEIYGSVIYDEDEQMFKMWYIGESPEDFADYATMYATSTDGIHWEKPLVGVKSARGLETNAVAPGYLLASVIKDQADPNPDRRYKMICWRQKQPYAAQSMTSPDGIHWTEVTDKPICRSSDVITGYYDTPRQKYVAFPKLNTMVRGIERRCFGVSTSDDFLTWTEPQLAFVPDLRDDAGTLARLDRARHILDRPDDPKLMRTEFYGIGLYPHESCLIAFPWVFSTNNNARYGNHEGPCEIQLAVSRNLVDWDRPFRTPVIPIDRRGAWDESYQQTAAQAIRVGDEIRLYYCGANYTNGTPVLYREKFEDGTSTGRKTKYSSAIGLVSWPLDRFVSVDGPAAGGTLTTVPLTHTGARLEINADVKAGGALTVELLDPAGNPLPGWKPSAPLTGDNLRHTVTFDDKTDVASLAGQPIVLRFTLKNAELYSFAFRPGRQTLSQFVRVPTSALPEEVRLVERIQTAPIVPLATNPNVFVDPQGIKLFAAHFGVSESADLDVIRAGVVAIYQERDPANEIGVYGLQFSDEQSARARFNLLTNHNADASYFLKESLLLYVWKDDGVSDAAYRAIQDYFRTAEFDPDSVQANRISTAQ